MSLEAQKISGELDRQAFDEAAAELRTELITLQRELRDADFSVVLVLEGDDRIGVNEVLGRLHQWLDVRSLAVNVYDLPADQARERPFFWRYWRDLPARGRIGIYINAWATRCAGQRLRGEINGKHLERRLASARDFEEQLIDDGTLVVKFWLHLDKKSSRKKVKRAQDEAESHWRLEDEDRLILENYGRAMKIADRVIEQGATPEPWMVVDGSCERFRDLTVGRVFCDRIRLALAASRKPQVKEEARASSPAIAATGEGRLAATDLSETLEEDEYRRRRDAAQHDLARLVAKLREDERSMILVFEGPDAAGKGGAIRRLAAALDPRDYRAHSIAAPTEEELARHYLWRFWKRLPGAGKVAIFDRSWYGRLLVERVEAFATEDEWRRAFHEIPSFERQLIEHGVVMIKFWLQIDPDEQMRRFTEREETPWKRHKITKEDYRNRLRWDDYLVAEEDMLTATDHAEAPWLVVAANDKRFARVSVLEGIVEHLERSLRSTKRPRRRNG